MPSTKCGINDAPGRTGQQGLVGTGPTLLVNVGFDPDYNTAIPDKIVLPPEEIWALVDTGAVECCIDSDLAAEERRKCCDITPTFSVDVTDKC